MVSVQGYWHECGNTNTGFYLALQAAAKYFKVV